MAMQATEMVEMVFQKNQPKKGCQAWTPVEIAISREQLKLPKWKKN